MAEPEASKRSAEEESAMDQQPSNKRAKADGPKVTLRFLIQSKSAGAIIGRGGNNINRLRKEFEAEISVPDCNGPERILTVTATLENVLGVIEDVLPFFEENKRSDTEVKKDPELRMLVHQSSAGAIIGRAGFKIKDLRESTSCNIKVYTEMCPHSFERVVQFNGKAESVINGLREVYKVVSESTIKGPIQEYDPFCHNERDYGGHHGDMQRGGGRRGPYGGGPPPFGGGGGNFGQMMQGPRRPMGNFGGRMQMRNGGGGGGRSGVRGGGRPRRDQEGYDFSIEKYMDDLPYDMSRGEGDGEIITTQVTIPKDFAGAIIGYQGDRIREIRRVSCAHIKIDEPLQGSDERIITIKGTHEAITNAQYLLQSSVKANAGAGRM